MPGASHRVELGCRQPWRTASTLAGVTPSPPSADAHNCTGADTALSASAPNALSGSAMTSALMRASFT